MRVIVGVTEPDHGRCELELVAALAFPQPAIELVNVVESMDIIGVPDTTGVPSSFAYTYTSMMKDQGKTALTDAENHARRLGFQQVTSQQRLGSTANELLNHADSVGADLMTVAAQRSSTLESVLLGSTARKLVTSARQSVLVARPGAVRTWSGRAILALDASDQAAAVVAVLRRLAPTGIKELRLLTAITPKDLSAIRQFAAGAPAGDVVDVEATLARRNETFAGALSGLSCRVTSDVVVDDVRPALRRAMSANGGADLLILGAQGHGFVHRLTVGSTSLHEAVHGVYPVLVLRPEIV